MTQAERNQPTYAEIIEDILRPLAGPILMDDLADRIQAIRPSSAKKPRQAVVSQIRQQEGKLLVRLDADTVLPLRLAFQGARFRIPLNREIVNTGLVEIETTLHSYLPPGLPLEQIQFLDKTGMMIPFQLKAVPRKIETFFGSQDITTQMPSLATGFPCRRCTIKIISWLQWRIGKRQVSG